jgi:alkylhydroperoxidase/carboxymuconolactone decarboxylase family protein YurZ
MTDDTRRAAAKADWLRRLNNRPTRDWHDAILEIDTGLFERMTRLYEVYNLSVIEPKLRHLIWVAVDAVPTHLYPVGIELHARAALNHGGTAREVLETLEIAATAGERSFAAALPVVLEELQQAGIRPTLHGDGNSADANTAKADYAADTGFVPPWLEELLRLSPDFTPATLAIGHGNARGGVLGPKARALITLAVVSCPAVLDLAATREQVRHALGAGATAEELVAVLELGSGIGLHALSLGVPALLRVLAERKG